MGPKESHTEIEAKLRVDDLAAVALRLREHEARYRGEHSQRDAYYDDPDGGLAGSDRCLRIRHETCGDRETRFVTYKGPKQRGAYKRRQELEFEVSDPEAVHLLLAALGYAPALVVEKTRQVWELDACQVGLDALPALGSFVEIEGPDEDAIARVQDRLGLGDCSHVPESYACLLAARQRG
jgi:adenylate cyclase class 2